MFITKNPGRHGIDCVNWPDAFPYAPDACFDIWHSGSHLHIHYRVKEDVIRAVCGEDRENIWEDSCVEFFFMPEGSESYINVECNAVGKIYMACGPDREQREFLSEESYKSVKRQASLGSVAFGLKDEGGEWEVLLDIPASIYGLESFDGAKGRGNFYNCGNGKKHFLSWAPIDTPTPDFHRPEFFRNIEFE